MQNTGPVRHNKAALGLIFVIMLMDVIGITLLSPIATLEKVRLTRINKPGGLTE